MRQEPTLNWENIDLVVFDVDGTLYDQRRLRAIMAANLFYWALRSRSLKAVKVLRAFRECREALAANPVADFTVRQFEDPARVCGCPVEQVRMIVGEWIEQRPVAFLKVCRFTGITELFEQLRRSGIIIAVFSDHPASEKLKALGVTADLVVCAADPDVMALKPDPKGLCKILDATGVSPLRSVMIGDRYDKDWLAAKRAGMPAIIRSQHKDRRCPTFRSYHDALFGPLELATRAPKICEMTAEESRLIL